MESLAAAQDPVGAEDDGQQVADVFELGEVILLAEAGGREPLGEAAPAVRQSTGSPSPMR